MRACSAAAIGTGSRKPASLVVSLTSASAPSGEPERLCGETLVAAAQAAHGAASAGDYEVATLQPGALGLD